MLPMVCRCCGAAIEVRAKDNPNVCQACANSDELFWEDIPVATAVATNRVFKPRTLASTNAPQTEQFLEVEGPSVLECFDAVEQAKRAIAESLAEEAAAAQALSKPTRTA